MDTTLVLAFKKLIAKIVVLDKINLNNDVSRLYRIYYFKIKNYGNNTIFFFFNKKS